MCRSMLSRRIRFDIFDRDRGKEQGDSLGWGHYNLDLVAEGQVTEQWIQLRNVFAGELRLRVLVLSGTDNDDHVRCSFSEIWACCHVCQHNHLAVEHTHVDCCPALVCTLPMYHLTACDNSSEMRQASTIVRALKPIHAPCRYERNA